MKEYFKTDLGTLYLGDCFEVMQILEEKSVDLVLTDPPYNTTACDWDVKIDLKLLWQNLKRLQKEKSVSVMTGSQPFTTDLINSNRKNFKYEWIWNKIQGANFFNLKNQPLKTHENILVFAENPNFVFNPQKVLRSEKSLIRTPIGKTNKSESGMPEHYGKTEDSKRKFKHFIDETGLKHPISILEFSSFETGRFDFKHPTKKPIELFKNLILTYSNENDLVLDPFSGSGTTAVACEKLNRRWIGIEQNEKYCEIAKQRVRNESRQIKMF